MDIEERAEKWAEDHTGCQAEKLIAVEAYLAGSAQTQADYSGHCDCACSNCSGCLA